MGSDDLRFVWLEITGRCQLECIHCYADSGPTGTHGSMMATDWKRVIDDVGDAGADTVQFIGGEPTLHGDLPELIDHAVARGLDIEVYTNLVHVTPHLWDAFARPGVRLATSWYSDDPGEHATITKRPSHGRTTANIAEAIRRSIPVRVGVVGVLDEQRVAQARKMLADLGIEDVAYDGMRRVGRASGRIDREDFSQLCGQCGRGNLAVSATGDVWPCVFARWLPVGNVHDDSLGVIIEGARMSTVAAELDVEFGQRPCVPNMCDPQCGPSCSPACRPANNCRPVGACVPWYR